MVVDGIANPALGSRHVPPVRERGREGGGGKRERVGGREGGRERASR